MHTDKTNRRWLGWNLRTFSAGLLIAGLLSVIALRSTVFGPAGPALVTVLVAAVLLSALAYAVFRSVRARPRRTLAAVVVVLGMTFVACWLVRNAALPWTTIEGRVVYAASEKPAAGVTVRLQPTSLAAPYNGPSNETRLLLAWFVAGSGQTKTDGQGRYRFAGAPLGSYNIWAESKDWTMAAIDSLAGRPNSAVTAPDIQLVRGAIVRGRVVDAATGKPLQIARPTVADCVMAIGPSRPASGGAVVSAPLDHDGAFLMRLAPGKNVLYVNNALDDPQHPNRFPVNLGEGDEQELQMTVKLP